MTFKHVFNSGSVAIVSVDRTSSFEQAACELLSFFSVLRSQDERFPDQELEVWFYHVLDWCGENLRDEFENN